MCAVRVVQDILAYMYLQTLVLEGAKIELNNTSGTEVGNGYTRYEFSVLLYNSVIFNIVIAFHKAFHSTHRPVL